TEVRPARRDPVVALAQHLDLPAESGQQHADEVLAAALARQQDRHVARERRDGPAQPLAGAAVAAGAVRLVDGAARRRVEAGERAQRGAGHRRRPGGGRDRRRQRRERDGGGQEPRAPAGAGRSARAAPPPPLARNASTSARGRVFTTSSAVSQARRAWETPSPMAPRPRTLWASVPMKTLRPAWAAARRWTSGRSRRRGEALCSTATRFSRHAAK